MRIFAATFNVAQLPLTKDSVSWLEADSADLVVLGFQEALPLRLALLGPLYTDPSKIQHQLGANLSPSFTLSHSSSYGGLLLLIYVKTRVDKGLSVQQVSEATCGVGPLFMRNKAAIAVRMSVKHGNDIHDYTFVCAHLAPHVHNTARRNEDWQECVQRLRFDGKHSIYDTDLLIVLGDLNYRLAEAKEEVKASFSNDQLTAEMKVGRTMHHLREAPITFPPSYKYKPSSQAYDPKRRPAWCDRILYWTRFEGLQIQYDVSREPTPSDHRAVVASFTYQPRIAGSRQAAPFAEDPLAARKALCGQLCSFAAGSLWNLAYAIGLGHQVFGGVGILVISIYLVLYY